MTLDQWLNHYARQPGYTIRIEWQDKKQYYVVYDEDGVICDWRPIHEDA